MLSGPSSNFLPDLPFQRSTRPASSADERETCPSKASLVGGGLLRGRARALAEAVLELARDGLQVAHAARASGAAAQRLLAPVDCKTRTTRESSAQPATMNHRIETPSQTYTCASWRQGSRTTSTCPSGCGTSCVRTAGRWCASCCGACRNSGYLWSTSTHTSHSLGQSHVAHHHSVISAFRLARSSTLPLRHIHAILLAVASRTRALSTILPQPDEGVDGRRRRSYRAENDPLEPAIARGAVRTAWRGEGAEHRGVGSRHCAQMPYHVGLGLGL